MTDFSLYTKFLVHANEADGSTSLVDSSNSAHTITANGNAAVKDFNADDNLVVNYSGYFSGSSAYLTVPNSSDFNFGTGDFCVECWILPTVGSTSQTLYDYNYHGTGSLSIALDTSAAPKPIIWLNGSAVLTATTGLELGVWTHLAVVRSSGILTIYHNGVANGAVSDSTEVSTTSTLQIGRAYTVYYNGYIAGLAIHKGDPVYTAAFTPSLNIYAMDNDANTVLFLDFTEITQGATPATITDSSASAHTVTNYSSSVSGCTFWWNGAVELDGTGDYLSVPDSTDWTFDASEFTIEFFMSANALATSYQVFSQGYGTTKSFNFILYANGGIQFTTKCGVTYRSVYSASGAIVLNKLYHVAVTRDVDTLRLYLNGIQLNTIDMTGVALSDSVDPLYVGGDGAYSGAEFNGLLAEFSILNGISKYPDGTTFTPPVKQLLRQDIDADIEVLLPIITAEAIQPGVYIELPLPEINSLAFNVILCAVDVSITIPEVSSYGLLGVLADVDINMLLPEQSSMATQQVITGDYNAAVPVLNFTGVNSITLVGNYEIFPELTSTGINPITCNVNFNLKKPVLISKCAESINLELPMPVIGSLGSNPIVGDVDLKLKKVSVSSYVYNWPECVVSLEVSLPKISSFAQSAIPMSVSLSLPKTELSSIAVQDIQAVVDLNVPLPKLKGLFDNPTAYTIVKYRKDYMCTL